MGGAASDYFSGLLGGGHAGFLVLLETSQWSVIAAEQK